MQPTVGGATRSNVRNPVALLPFAMSLGALAVVAARIALVGTAPEPDEGTAAHLWQLLMAGQLPVIAFFAVTWLPRRPGAAAAVLALQLAAALAAMAPVYLLGW